MRVVDKERQKSQALVIRRERRRDPDLGKPRMFRRIDVEKRPAPLVGDPKLAHDHRRHRRVAGAGEQRHVIRQAAQRLGRRVHVIAPGEVRAAIERSLEVAGFTGKP